MAHTTNLLAVEPKNFSLKGFVRLVRAGNLVILAATQLLAGIAARPEHWSWWKMLLQPPLWFLVGATVCVAAGGYIINDYYDVKIDIINKPSRVVIDRLLKRRVAIVLHLLFTVTGILLTFPLGKKIGLIVLASAFILWFYSNFLKRQPFWGNLTVAIVTGLAVWLPALYYENNETAIRLFALYAFCISLIREIIKDMEDMRGDARYGCRTLPIVWGIRATKWLLAALTALLAILLIAGLDLLPKVAAYSLLVLFVPLGYFTKKMIAADKIRDYRQLSILCKNMMLLGILAMLLI